MTGLLDTHAYLWMVEGAAKLSPAALAFVRDPNNRLLLSVISVHELVIKIGAGKLRLDRPASALVADLPAAGIDLLPVRVEHVLAVGGLPRVHRDPFDRLLVAQALVEGCALLSADADVRRYPVPLVW